MRQVFALTSVRDPSLSAVSQAGLVNNAGDGLAWGLFPLFFAQAGLDIGRIVCSPPSTRPCGASANSSPVPCPTASDARA